MSYSPRYSQNANQLQQNQTIDLLSSKKQSFQSPENKIYQKVIKYQRFKNNLSAKQDRITSSTQPKFYQKSQKRTQNSIFKHKMESIKPITCYQYEENQFMIEPKKKFIGSKTKNNQQNIIQQNLAQKQQIHTPCIGLINPMYINVKSNLKRLTNSCQSMKDRDSMNKNYNRNNQKNQMKVLGYQSQQHTVSGSGNSPVKKDKHTQNLYFRIVSQMNQYFNAMKLDSFKNNKTLLLSKRGIKSHSQKRSNLLSKGLNNQNLSKRNTGQQGQTSPQNMNIISLKPVNSNYKRINRNFSNNSQNERFSTKNTTEINNLNLLKIYQSQQIQSLNNQKQYLQNENQTFVQCDFSSMIISNNICSSPVRRGRDGKSMYNSRQATQELRNTANLSKRIILNKGFCFGQMTNPRLSPDELYRLKILYYKDMIWKSSFNLGLRYIVPKNNNSENTNLKYFVGKGNNSKLIKNIMAKRWWWSLDSKEDNSNFIWTQLKIYSIYQKQQQFVQNQNSQKQIQPTKNQTDKQLSKEQINPEQVQKITKKSTDCSSLLLNNQKRSLWEQYITNKQNRQRQKKITQQNMLNMRKRLQSKLKPLKNIQSPSKITNHLQFSKFIGNKKALYKVMMLYFNSIKKYHEDEIYVPLTYHITAGLQDQQYLKFLTQYYRRNKNNNKTCWIVKPGQLTNRGRGIIYCRDLNQIKPIIKKKEAHANGSLKTFLIQQYIDRPLLYRGRKFDIRHYIMINSINGKIYGYFYQQGYIRTTSYKYKLDDNSPAIHLTNDAVQKYCKDYGKYQKGNKLSYQQLDAYLQEKYPSQKEQNKITFFNTIHPQIKKISTDVIHAAYYFIDPKKKLNNFQIFGLDIMIDQNLKCYLIEVNTNPCLQLSSPVLKAVIPGMLDNALTISLDTCYPPPEKQILHQYHKKYKYTISPQNKFELVFDQDQEGRKIRQIYESQKIQPNQLAGIGDDDENFQSCQEDSEQY